VYLETKHYVAFVVQHVLRTFDEEELLRDLFFLPLYAEKQAKELIAWDNSDAVVHSVTTVETYVRKVTDLTDLYSVFRSPTKSTSRLLPNSYQINTYRYCPISFDFI
jgi:hypothetical protein